MVGEPRVDWDDREREEDAEEISPIAVSSGKPEGRPLTHFFRPALSRAPPLDLRPGANNGGEEAGPGAPVHAVGSDQDRPGPEL